VLACVYVYPYSINGDQVTIGEGSNWEVNPDTGELEFYEDFAAETEEITTLFEVSGDELTLSLSNSQILEIVLSLAELLELDPAADLGLVLDAQVEVSDEELEDIFNLVFISGVAVELGVDLIDLGLEKGVGLDEGILALTKVLTLALLENGLGLDTSGLDITLDADATAVDLGLAIAAELGEELDEESLAELESAQADLDEAAATAGMALEDLRQVKFTRSSQDVIVPSGSFQLPNNITAISVQSWGRLKDIYRR